MPHLSAKLEERDSDYRTSTVTISVHGKSQTTPKRALNLKDTKTESRLITNGAVRGINEVTALIDKTRLDKIDGDINKQTDFCGAMQLGVESIQKDHEISFYLLFHERNQPLEDREIEYMVDLLDDAKHNDIIVPPFIKGLSVEEYVRYLRVFMDFMPNTEIMGSIPFIAHFELRQILDFYEGKGVRFFVVDLEGKNPLKLYSNINPIYRRIRKIEKELGGEETCYLHATNVRKPRGLFDKQLATSNDILLYEMGFNSFGSFHLRQGGKRDVIPEKEKETKAWVFNRFLYTYHSSDTVPLKNLAADDSQSYISVGEVCDAPEHLLKLSANLFNVERHGIEANEIRRRLRQNEFKGYLGTKTLATTGLREVRRRFPVSML